MGNKQTSDQSIEIVKKSFSKKYILQNLLGKGSFGCVYAVVRRKDKKEFAAKMIIIDGEDNINECRIM